MTLFGDTTGDPLQEGTEVQTAARNIFAGCIPERDEEVKALWADFDLRFRLAQDSHDGEKIVMRGGLYRYVDFNHRTLRAFWVAGYAAWEGYSVMAESIATGRQGSLARFKELVEAVRRIAGNAEADSEPLPEGVAEPGQYDGQAVQERAASELATFAACWAFLHEVRHIQHQREGTSADTEESDPSKRHEEELSCDRFAADFLLARVEKFAADQSVLVEKVRQKREIGVYFALFAMGVLADGKFGDSATHPALVRRIQAVQETIGAKGTCEAQMIGRLAFEALRQLQSEAPTVPITLCA